MNLKFAYSMLSSVLRRCVSVRISCIHVLHKHIISQFEVIYGQGIVIYALKNPYMDVLVIYKFKSCIYVVFFKSYYMVKGTVFKKLHLLIFLSYMNSNHPYTVCPCFKVIYW